MVEDPKSVVLQVHELKVTLGQHIMAGDTLAVLSDHSRLLVEGEAFEHDAAALARAMKEGWPLTLLPAEPGGKPEQVKLLYLADSIDPVARTFHFYAELPNRLVHDAPGADSRRYVQWRFRPGERLRVQVPVERWPSRLVVPVSVQSPRTASRPICSATCTTSSSARPSTLNTATSNLPCWPMTKRSARGRWSQ